MTITNELKKLEKVQARLIKFCKYIENEEKQGSNKYNDLYIKISSVIGTIEEALNFDS